MVKHQVKVVIRTRPTANFASKNIQIDPLASVNNIIIKPFLDFAFLIHQYCYIDCESADPEEREWGFHKQPAGAVEV